MKTPSLLLLIASSIFTGSTVLPGAVIVIEKLSRRPSACAVPAIFKTTMATKNQEYILDQPYKCLILEPTDWHTMDNFTPDAILMVLASEYFDQNDYIFDPYADH